MSTTVEVTEITTTVEVAAAGTTVESTPATVEVSLATTGPQGPSGKSLHTGVGVPDPSFGAIGDTYIDKQASQLYGPKSQDTGWGTPTPLGDAGFVSQFNLGQPNDGQAIIYDAATSLWVSKTIRYTHTQSAAASSWTINHNLGVKPAAVSIVDSGDTIVVGNITHTNANTLVVTFSSAFSGKAYIS